MTLTIRLLGAPTVEGATGPVDPARQARLTELAAYLLLNPGAASGQMDEALWPDRAGVDNGPTRCSAVSRLRRWLVDEAGGEAVPRHPVGGFRLVGVVSDVEAWPVRDPRAAADEDLVAALELVRGMPLDGVSARHYGWADAWRLEWVQRIKDVALERGRRQLAGGDPAGAELAAAIGLKVAPLDEALWRLRITAALRAGNVRAAVEAASRVTAVHDRLRIPLEGRTERLIDLICQASLPA